MYEIRLTDVQEFYQDNVIALSSNARVKPIELSFFELENAIQDLSATHDFNYTDPDTGKCADSPLTQSDYRKVLELFLYTKCNQLIAEMDRVAAYDPDMKKLLDEAVINKLATK
jgi:hypothetical protein